MHKLIIYILLFFFYSLCGQDKTDSTSSSRTIQIDSSQIEVREFTDNLNEKYNTGEFNYNLKDGESQNLLARFLSWLLNWLRQAFGIDIPPGAGEVIEIVIYILMGALAIYLLVRFLLGERAAAFFVKGDKHIASLGVTEERIQQIDFDSLIKDALAQNNYRDAIRFLYLKALKNLSQSNIIDWHFEKTNTDYYNEIADEDIKKAYSNVSYLYDYVWYGEFTVDEKSFNDAMARFKVLDNLISK